MVHVSCRERRGKRETEGMRGTGPFFFFFLFFLLLSSQNSGRKEVDQWPWWSTPQGRRHTAVAGDGEQTVTVTGRRENQMKGPKNKGCEWGNLSWSISGESLSRRWCFRAVERRQSKREGRPRLYLGSGSVTVPNFPATTVLGNGGFEGRKRKKVRERRGTLGGGMSWRGGDVLILYREARHSGSPRSLFPVWSSRRRRSPSGVFLGDLGRFRPVCMIGPKSHWLTG